MRNWLFFEVRCGFCENKLDDTNFINVFLETPDSIRTVDIAEHPPENSVLFTAKKRTERPEAHGTPTRVKGGLATLGSLDFESELGWEEAIHDKRLEEEMYSL